jgi:hypothetical protein
MDTNPPRVVTIEDDAEIDRAIATLVLTFGTDPVARWMYADPHQYLLHILDYSEPSKQARLQREPRSSPMTASGSLSGFQRVFMAMKGRLRRLLQKASLEGSKPKSPPYSNKRNITGQPSPLVPVAHRRRSFAPKQGAWCGTAAAPPSPMRPGASPGVPLVIEPAKYLSIREAWL